MGGLVAEILPRAAVVAISPIPVLAVVLMLLTDRGRSNSLAYLGGWAAGMTTVALIAAAAGAGEVASDPSRPVAVGMLAIAAAFAVGAVVEFRRRPRRGEEHVSPWWARLLHGMGPGQAFGLGVVLVVANAKDALAALDAGGHLGASPEPPAAKAAALAAFVLVGCMPVIVPIAIRFAMGDSAQPTLHRWRAWLERHGPLAVAIVLAVVAAALVVQAVPALGHG